MKKILIALLVFLSAIFSYGQLPKKQVLIGSSISFAAKSYNTLNFNGGKETDIDINISLPVGYFLKDNIALGLNPSFGYRSDKKGKPLWIRKYGLSPFIKKFLPISEKWFFTFEGTWLLQQERYFYTSREAKATIKVKTNIIGLAFSPGITYFLPPHVGIQLQIPFLQIIHSNTVASLNYDNLNSKYWMYGINKDFINSMNLGVFFLF